LRDNFDRGVLGWVLLISPLSRYGAANVDGRHLVFLGQSVRQKRHVSAMEKIQNPILHMPTFGAKLVNAVPQNVCVRPAQLVPELSQ
jgi:hypothetical protein